jgi:hypothetical protein
MQEIQIGGLGANAEYGGFTGGIINGVTKSGGNEVHGGIEAYYQPNSWVANNTPSELGTQAPFKFHDYAVSLGGAIKQDKLWYFISGEDWEQDTAPVGAAVSSPRKVPRYLGKLTWQAGTNNRFQFMAEHDGLVQDYRGVSGTELPEATYKEESPNLTLATSWESLINANNFLSLKRAPLPPPPGDVRRLLEPVRGRALRPQGLAHVQVRRDLRESHRQLQLAGQRRLHPVRRLVELPGRGGRAVPVLHGPPRVRAGGRRLLQGNRLRRV